MGDGIQGVALEELENVSGHKRMIELARHSQDSPSSWPRDMLSRGDINMKIEDYFNSFLLV